MAKDVVVLVSQTLEDPTDPRLLVPTKFVGSVYAESAAHTLAKKHNWTESKGSSGLRNFQWWARADPPSGQS